MRTVGFGRNFSTARAWSCRRSQGNAGLFFSPAIPSQSCFSSLPSVLYTHKSSYQSKQGQHFFCVSPVWKIAGGAGGVGVHACMWMIPSTLMPPHPHHLTVPSAHPGEKLGSVTAAHTRWLSKKGQVVVPSAAQSSVDAAHADISLPQTAAGRGKICFSICLGSATPSSTHCPSHSLLHSGTPSPPVLTRWLPEHLFT